MRRRQFLHELGQQTRDLKELVNNLQQELQSRKKAKQKYEALVEEYGEEEARRRLLSENFPHEPDEQWRKYWRLVMIELSPRFFLLPDTNIYLDAKAKQELERFAKDGIGIYELDIVRLERKRGGLRAPLPEAIVLDGPTSSIEPPAVDSPRSFYALSRATMKRCISEFYAWFDEQIERSVKGREHELSRLNGLEHLIKKEQELYRRNRRVNHVADRTLVSTSLILNLLYGAYYVPRFIVVTNDADLEAYFQLTYDEILPRYFVEVLLASTDEETEVGRFFRETSPERLIEATREHLRTMYRVLDEEFAAGIIYMPRSERFRVFPVASGFSGFFQGLDRFVKGKRHMIEEMVRSDDDARTVYQRLIDST